MKIEIPEELARQIQRNSVLQGISPEQLVVELVTKNLAPIVKPKKLTMEEYDKILQEIIDLHPKVTHFVDVSRDSIYEGRGE